MVKNQCRNEIQFIIKLKNIFITTLVYLSKIINNRNQMLKFNTNDTGDKGDKSDKGNRR